MGETSREAFDFVDINPGMSGLAFAAEAEGGVCIGVHGVKRNDRERFEGFFGVRSSEPPEVSGDLVLVNLPFSMFAGSESGDPAVSDLVSLAQKSSKGVGAVLFRVYWGRARRLRVDPDEYRSVVEARFDRRKWEVSTAVSNDGNDLFVVAVNRAKWNGKEPLPVDFPFQRLPQSASNPQEMLVSMGYPVNFALHNASVDPKLLEGIVFVPNARIAVAGTLESVR